MRVSDRLSGYLDDELDASERWEVKLHLEGCARCASTLAEIAATVAALHRLRGVAGLRAPLASRSS